MIRSVFRAFGLARHGHDPSQLDMLSSSEILAQDIKRQKENRVPTRVSEAKTQSNASSNTSVALQQAASAVLSLIHI